MSAIALLLLAACAVQKPDGTLVDAVRSGDAAAVRALCARGAGVNAPAGGNGWTPLLHAVHKNQTGTAAALLDSGADVNRPAPNGTTPLMMAAGYGKREMVALLLSRGADAKRLDDSDAAAIDYALTGVTDLDAFTFFACQDDTAALLTAASPRPQTSSLRWARMKGCDVSSSVHS
jgi:hypothetical protein